MPLYKWWGIDLAGLDQRGLLTARSVEQLEKNLFEQDIALLKSQQMQARIATRTWLERKVAWLQQLTTLLGAGIYIDQALELVMIQEPHKAVRAVWQDIILEVHHGVSLAQALSRYPALFDSLTVQVIAAGQEAGSLSTALLALACYYEDMAAWRQQIRRALAGPLLTFGFFCAIALLIFVIILPNFASFFASTGHPLPATTAAILSFGQWLRHWGLVMMGLGIVGGGIGCYWLRHSPKFISYCIGYCWYLPLIGPIIKLLSVHQLCQVFSLLLGGGISIKPALELLEKDRITPALRFCIIGLEDDILKGVSLHESFGRHPEIFSPQLIAFIRIGEASATLPAMLMQGAKISHEEALARLKKITFIIQPLLMILLGFLIAGLIMAVYMPIITLSYVIA